ncbi:MAG: HAMP domain-containing sensor histidine kinase [Anaerolineales bacterium]
MFSSLRARLWLSYLVVVGAALGVVVLALLAFLWQSPLVYREASGRLLAVQRLLDRLPAGEWLGLRPVALTERIARLDENFDVRVLVFAADRTLLADSRPGQAPLRLPRLLVARNFAFERDAQGNAWIYALRRLDDDHWLMLAVPRPRLAALTVLRDDLLMPLLGAGVTGLGLAVLMAYILSRWVADPLQQVVTVTSNMPDVEAPPVPLRGPREVQNLVQAFNAMLARLQASQRSQRAFVANVSHELKTPLTSIQGFAQALLDDTAGTPEARRQAAQVIYDESARMHRMVLDLLDLARLDAGMMQMKREPLDLHALLRSVTEKFAPQARAAGVEVMLQAADLPPCPGDGDRLAQVFTNLLDNALKFTPAGGVVSVMVREAQGSIEVEVKDSGSGMDAGQLEHIFDRFYQADPARAGGARHGAGLGLSIAREIVHAHGGKITVRSAPGQGSTFTVTLPLAVAIHSGPTRRRS